jgi:hypothetical protein
MIGSPVGMAIAAMTVMLWIIWSDTIRARRPTVILYSIRVLLFLVMSWMLVSNIFRQPWLYNSTTKTLTWIAAGVGVLGAAYFVRRIVRRR